MLERLRRAKGKKMNAKRSTTCLFLFVCFALIIGCGASSSSVGFPDNHIRGDYSIDYSQKVAVPIKVTFKLDDDDDLSLPETDSTSTLLPYIFVDKIAGFAFSSATGNVISHDGLVLTNHHVVDENPFRIHVMVGEHSKIAAPASIVAVNEENDLAVIKINYPFSNIAHFGSADDIRINQTIYYWGYPYGLSQNSAGKCFHRGFISRLNVRNNFFSPLTRFYMGIRGAPGVSGSGIYTADGRIIGMMQGYVASGQHFVAIPVDQITEFLRLNKIPYSN